MRLSLGLSLVIVGICAATLGSDAAQVSAGADSDATRQEQVWFEGVWRYALVEVEGVRQPDMPFETNKLIIANNGRFAIVQGTKVTRGTLRVDPTTTPKHYDFSVTEGPGKGLTALGIYERGGDTFKICLPLRGQDRPTLLVSRPGSGCLFQVFQREGRDVNLALAEIDRQETESKN